MRRVLSVLLVFLLTLPAYLYSGATSQEPQGQQPTQTAANVLTNKDVLDMLKVGLASEIIIAKIKSSACNFDTSPSALEELKTAGATDSVILAMIQVPRAGDASASPPVSTTAKPPELVEVKVPDGTPIEIELAANVSSEAVQEGSIVDFAVLQPVKVNDLTVIERGASARGRIMEVKKARHWGRAGKLVWSMQDVLTVDGNRIPARFSTEAKGGGSSGKVAGAVVATAIVFWPAAPLWGLKKGKPAVIPAGQRFQAFTHGDSTVKAKAPQQALPPAEQSKEAKQPN